LEIPKYTFDSNILLFNLGDVHRGDLCCIDSLFHKAIYAIERTPNAFWVSTGDLLNCAFKDSVSDSYKSKPLGAEFKTLKAELAPIAQKCLGVTTSNHHRRFEKKVGMSLDEILCDSLGLPFMGNSCIINLTLGRACYYVALHHGIGGGRMRGGKTNNLERFFDIYPGADIYMQGHTHTFDFFIEKIQYIDRKRGSLVSYPAYFCTTAHFLEWKESYGEEYRFKPSKEGCAVLTLYHRKKGNFAVKKVKADLFN
jgi:hypothetical protein